MDAGQVELLVILGGNPVFTAPADLKFSEKLAKVGMTVSHGLYADETANLCHWNVAEAHPLESWGDARAYDGTVTVIQPLIAPLYEGRSAHEVLGVFTAQPDRHGSQIVKDYWTRAFGRGQRLVDPRRRRSTVQGRRHVLAPGPARRVHRRHRDRRRRTGHAVHGAVRGRAVAAAAAVAPAATAAPPPAPEGALEIIFRPDPTIWDGRFANNGWLQELPKPLTKITWDPSAWISPQLARERGLSDGDVIELRYRGNTARMPVFGSPAIPTQSVTAFFGYGRRLAGRVGTATAGAEAFNVYLLRTSDAPWFGSGLEISKTGDRYLLATTQEHHLMEGRAPVRVATLEEYTHEPAVIQHQGHSFPRTLTMYPDHPYEGHKWGMAIDLTSCTGCGACTMACTAENNIPVVGKEQVAAGREMHWIRVDHYFAGKERTSRAASLSRRTTSPCPACSARTRRASSSVRWPRRRTAPKA